jgi:hypothetical protein
MIALCCIQPAFHPKTDFEIQDLWPLVFAIARSGGGQNLLALTNISSCPLTVAAGALAAASSRDLLSNHILSSEQIVLAPHGILGLIPA